MLNKKFAVGFMLALSTMALAACGDNEAKFSVKSHQATSSYPISKSYTLDPSGSSVSVKLDGHKISEDKWEKKNDGDVYVAMKTKTQKLSITNKDDSDTYTKTVTVPKLTTSQNEKNKALLAKKVKKAKKEKANFAAYKNDLKTIPSGTNGAITSAYYDKTSEQTILVLSDDAMGFSDNELKMVAKSAWNLGTKMENTYSPMTYDANAGGIVIQDSAGDQIAHSSMFGNFKFDYDK